jgi:CBS domain-containing protein
MQQSTEHIDELPVLTLIGGAIQWVSPSADLFDVARELAAREVGVLVVGDSGSVQGVISERDIVRAVAAGRDLVTTRANECATSQLVWCDAESTIAEVANEMMERYVRHVLVEDDGNLVGIVSARDVLGAYATGSLELE